MIGILKIHTNYIGWFERSPEQKLYNLVSYYMYMLTVINKKSIKTITLLEEGP